MLFTNGQEIVGLSIEAKFTHSIAELTLGRILTYKLAINFAILIGDLDAPFAAPSIIICVHFQDLIGVHILH